MSSGEINLKFAYSTSNMQLTSPESIRASIEILLKSIGAHSIFFSLLGQKAEKSAIHCFWVIGAVITCGFSDWIICVAGSSEYVSSSICEVYVMISVNVFGSVCGCISVVVGWSSCAGCTSGF